MAGINFTMYHFSWESMTEIFNPARYFGRTRLFRNFVSTTATTLGTGGHWNRKCSVTLGKIESVSFIHRGGAEMDLNLDKREVRRRAVGLDWGLGCTYTFPASPAYSVGNGSVQRFHVWMG